MTYIDGFVIPVPTSAKQAFLDHAHAVDKFFIDYGARRVVECWADDLPDGTVTDFKRSVAATADESVVFSWIEWPDKTTRGAAMTAMATNVEMMALPMPLDGKRMILGGFMPIVDENGAGKTGYVDGFVTPVTPVNRDAYIAVADKASVKFLSYGALRSSENWGDEVPDGKVTDMKRAVQAADGEVVVFSWVEWPDKATRDASWAKMMADPDMQPDTMPFDGKRMIWGGFLPIYTVEK
jgi:uncharacterized protein YbaA (DUF1428 family)